MISFVLIASIAMLLLYCVAIGLAVHIKASMIKRQPFVLLVGLVVPFIGIAHGMWYHARPIPVPNMKNGMIRNPETYNGYKCINDEWCKCE